MPSPDTHTEAAPAPAGPIARALRGRHRTLWLAGLVVLLAIGAVGAVLVYPRVAMRLSLRPEMVPLDGYTLAVRDTGSGGPAVVIEAGLACTKEGYDRLHYDLAKKTRVISYDHAGIGQSTPSGSKRTLPSFAAELRALLAKLDVPPPYILVGHSLGGHMIRYYAHLYPDEVAGLVFIDHPHEDWLDYIRQTWPEPEAKEYFKWWTPEGSTYTGVALEELLLYDENCDLIRGTKIRSDIPVLMFTGSNDNHFQKGEQARDRIAWRKTQASLLEGVEDAEHIVDFETSHWPHHDKPEMFERKIGAFIDHVREVRDGRAQAAQLRPGGQSSSASP